jgi:hypothetical protein
VSRQKPTTEKARRFLNTHGHMRRKYGIEQFSVSYKIRDGKYIARIALIFYVQKEE